MTVFGQPTGMGLPVRPLLDALPRMLGESGGTYKRAYRVLGVGHQRIKRWHRDGLTVDEADDMAGLLKRHPSELWGSAYYEAVDRLEMLYEKDDDSAIKYAVCAAEGCYYLFGPGRPTQRYCSPTCRQRMASRRAYRDHRDARLAAMRVAYVPGSRSRELAAWRRRNADRKRAQDASYRAAHRDRLREYQRARRAALRAPQAQEPSRLESTMRAMEEPNEEAA